MHNVSSNIPELYIDIDEKENNTEYEWNEIELKTQIERRKSSVVISEIEDDLNFNQLTLDELEDYFDLIDINEQLQLIQPEIKKYKKNSLYNLINLILPCKVQKLKPSLLVERDRIFAIALTQFNKSEHMNFRLLITIYEILLQKKGYFTEKVNQLQQSIKLQNCMLSSNNLEMPLSRKTSFRRFKHVKSFRLRNSFGNQSIKNNTNNLLNGTLNNLTMNNDDEIRKRNKSVDLTAFKNDKILNSEYKYRLNDQEIDQTTTSDNQDNSINQKTDNSLDSFPTSFNSNFEYQSAFSKLTDLNSNHLNGNLNNKCNQFNSTGHLSINNCNLNYSYSTRNNSIQSSLRSAISLSYSRKSSNASNFNERISIELIHRSIQYGDHWVSLGFQGNDPTSDLRGLGILSLFQLCFLLISNERLALHIYELSLDARFNFPFALFGIKISQICIQVLRQGCLNKIFNNRNEIFHTYNTFYCSLFLKFYQLWSEGKNTILNSDDVIKELRKLAATKPKQLMEKLNNFDLSTLKDKDEEEDDKIKIKINDEKVIEFTDISKIVDN